MKLTDPRTRKSSKMRDTHAAAIMAGIDACGKELFVPFRYTTDIVVKYGRYSKLTSRSKAVVEAVDIASGTERHEESLQDMSREARAAVGVMTPARRAMKSCLLTSPITVLNFTQCVKTRPSFRRDNGKSLSEG